MNVSEHLMGNRYCKVYGSWFGSRGSISTKTKKFFDEIRINRFLTFLAQNIILDSLGITHYHIYLVIKWLLRHIILVIRVKLIYILFSANIVLYLMVFICQYD